MDDLHYSLFCPKVSNTHSDLHPDENVDLTDSTVSLDMTGSTALWIDGSASKMKMLI